MKRALVIVATLVLPACGARAPATPAPAAAAGLLSGQLLRSDTAGGIHEVPDVGAVVRFRNDGDRACIIQRFTVAWGAGGPFSGQKVCRPEALVVEPRAEANATCIIASTTQLGGAPGLSVDGSRIEDIAADCGAR